MPEDSFSIKDLGETIAKMLGASVGDHIELMRDKLDKKRIMVVLHPAQEQDST